MKRWYQNRYLASCILYQTITLIGKQPVITHHAGKQQHGAERLPIHFCQYPLQRAVCPLAQNAELCPGNFRINRPETSKGAKAAIGTRHNAIWTKY